MKTKTENCVTAAMLAALTCIATMVIKVPSPLKGYLNLGDCTVLLSGWLLPGGFGIAAAGVGSALADVLSGYVLYAPATFVIKGLMALAAFGVFRLFKGKKKQSVGRVISGVSAEVIMILGYYIFEGFLYGFKSSAINIPANGVQGAAGLVIGLILIKVFEKNKIFKI